MTFNTLTDMTLHVSCEKTFRRLFYYPLNEHFFNLIFLRLTFFLEKKMQNSIVWTLKNI